LKKCHFFKDTVDYLGHVIRPGQLSVAEKNTAALKDMTHPTSQTELRSFLAFVMFTAALSRASPRLQHR
jgi:hypothetical protein